MNEVTAFMIGFVLFFGSLFGGITVSDYYTKQAIQHCLETMKDKSAMEITLVCQKGRN